MPLAFGALELPTKAMNLPFSTTLYREQARAIAPAPAPSSDLGTEFPIFTTSQVREQFLHPQVGSVAITPESVREHFFKTYVPYGSIIYREALRNNLPPELVAAVVEAESDFRPRLISHKNARGLMQIIPSTGRLMGASDLFNPADNIAAGTKYLRYLFNRFGDQRMVLAAYNAGEGNVDKFGGIPPFAETQNYLRRVASRSSHYRQRVRGTYVTSLRLRRSLE
ncbi:MAG TPA: lytic transglycosylase domain-containing protein [Thermoanaerobaculia bacterium]|nr:lytic transglycosylase domain-containing protein [Thermoanaerobaculia bacterium]